MSTALSPGGYVRQGQRNASPARSVNVQVAVRCRPLNTRERTHGERDILVCDEDRREVVFNAVTAPRKPVPSTSASTSASGKRTFTYDYVFGSAATQGEVYARLVEPIVDEVLQGYNCTVFAYGQTGTGKTHTMEGCRNESDTNVADRRLAENAGIIPRAVKQVFDHLRSLTDEHSVRVSHLELYNEQLTDLLSPDDFSTDSLRVYEDPQKGTFVQGLEDIVVRSEEEIFAILDKSAVKRKTAETLMNKYSSRSHSIFSITIHIKESTPDGADLLKVGKLNLVDLAGSENVGRSGAVKGRAREAGNINQSLLTLGRVITALVDRHPHVPYRDSKLTRLLQESLGGRNKTCIIATVTPGSNSVEETASTLDYAYRAKSIKNRPTVNQMIAKHVLLREYTEEIAKLKQELDMTREKNGVYLAPDEYQSMQMIAQSQSTQISDLELRTGEYEQKISDLRGKLERVQCALARDQKVLAETQKHLSIVTNDLNETRQKLEITTRERDENIYIVRSQEATEEELYKQGQQLNETLSTSIADVASLHRRVDFKSALELENIQNLYTLKKSVSSQVSSICERFANHRILHEKMSNESSSILSKVKEDLSSGLQLVMSHLNLMHESILMEEEKYVKNAQSDHGALLNHCNSSSVEIKNQLESFSSQVSEKRKFINETCNCIREVFNISTERVSSMIASFELFRTAQKEQYVSLQTEQSELLSKIEEQMSAFADRQNRASEQLLLKNEMHRKQQVDEMRLSKKTLLERISLIMDELIGSSVARGEEMDNADHAYRDAVNATGQAAVECLTDGHETLTGIAARALASSSSAAEELSQSLKDIMSKNNLSIQEGRECVNSIGNVSSKLQEACGESQRQCQREVDGMIASTKSFGESRQTRREEHGERCRGVIKSCVDSVDKSREGLCSSNSVTCNEIEHKIMFVDGMTKDLTTVLDDELSRGVDQLVTNHPLAVDRDAGNVPPKRTWPLPAVLVKTRDHDELIAEFRNKVSSGFEDAADVSNEMCVVSDNPMSDVEQTSIYDKENDSTRSRGDSKVDKGSEADDEGQSSTRDGVETGEINRIIRKGTSSERTDSTGTEQTGDVSERDTKASTTDTSGTVLSDVSNRRTRPRSVRKIEPVIRKAAPKTGIPAPRTRSIKRSGRQHQGVNQDQ